MDVQREKLTGCDKLFEEKRSGTTDARPRLKECLNYVRDGDQLIVTRIDRLARSTLHLCQIAETLREKGVDLVGCEMQLAWDAGTSIKQTRCAPVHSFEAWADPFAAQSSFWPDEITLGQEFFETLCEHAVPLDPRAVHALQHSALAMDIYSWLAHRLCRIRTDNGVKLYWKNLRDQFGQEYKCPKDFKKKFAPAMRKVLTVYPSANVRQEHGGMRLFPSPPPIRKTRAVVSLPRS